MAKKLKTHKSTVKKVKVTGAKKLITRKAGQDHFNARESGKVKRNKRSDVSVAKADQRNIRLNLPYS